ncbi:hypothetical protein ANN_14109 [Periplaneta americana]|uniref:Uncharacterized protein n=1 Tax=Periplaneta americana TaxID=6978 RepID=A0ABQ8SWU0_PERAM|nr:hypothetical protein ANN_14109 [Periplaneta americana]
MKFVVPLYWCRDGGGPSASLDPKTIENCHYKLMLAGFIVDTRRRDIQDRGNSANDEGYVHKIPQKSTRQVTRESGFTHCTIRNVLKNEFSYRP